MDYKSIVDNLNPEKVKQLLYDLGAEYVDDTKENCLITNTICHNTKGGSMKLYFYFDTHIFYCYTNCESMSIFKFLEHYYKTRQIDYDWYEDVYTVALNCSIQKSLDGFSKVERINLKERYRKKEQPKLNIYTILF